MISTGYVGRFASARVNRQVAKIFQQRFIQQDHAFLRLDERDVAAIKNRETRKNSNDLKNENNKVNH